MKRRQVLIHSAYWIIAFLVFTLCYSFIGSVDQGVLYVCVSLSVAAGVTYFFIWWAVPFLLLEDRHVLFALLTATAFLGALNIQIVVVLTQRIFLADNILTEIAFVHWDTFFLMLATIFFSLPVITYETLRNWNEKQKEVTQLQQNDREEFIQVKSDGKTHRISSANIRFIESYGDYAHIHLADRKIITRMTLKKLDKLLSNIIRVHRSYLVNPDFCQAFNLEEVTVDKKEIPVGRTFKNNVSKMSADKEMAT